MKIITTEAHLDFVGFELSVTSPPDCQCDSESACKDCNVKTIIIDANGLLGDAAPERLVIRGRKDVLQRMLCQALTYVETP